MCVCVRERETETETERQRESQRSWCRGSARSDGTGVPGLCHLARCRDIGSTNQLVDHPSRSQLVHWNISGPAQHGTKSSTDKF